MANGKDAVLDVAIMASTWRAFDLTPWPWEVRAGRRVNGNKM